MDSRDSKSDEIRPRSGLGHGAAGNLLLAQSRTSLAQDQGEKRVAGYHPHPRHSSQGKEIPRHRQVRDTRRTGGAWLVVEILRWNSV